MKLGKVVGKIVSTMKDSQLKGAIIFIVQPLNENLEEVGEPIIAVDGVESHDGSLIFYIQGREGTLTLEGRTIPSDAGIVGIVDRIGK
ncbi:EutN/CcmL family microcompartment protein [bacterium]|nr:EutN/CcmL family microcompartment protein [bacterium]